MRGTLVLAATLCLGSAAPVQPVQVERLDLGHEPIVRDFRAGKGRARLIAILSPT
jgi:hypothetical protein